MNEIIVAKTYDILRKNARNGHTITYGYLYRDIGVDTASATDRNRGSDILDEVNRRSMSEYDVMISSIVVNSRTDISDSGFFKLAKKIGKLDENVSVDREIEFWKNEKEKAFLIFGDRNNVKICDILKHISSNYLLQKTKQFAGNKLAEYIRKEPSNVLKELINDDDLVIVSSAGQGGWAEIPWIAIYNKKETDGPQEGVYIVYLFSRDFNRIYLCLNFGITKIIERDGKKEAFRKMTLKANEIRSKNSLDGYLSDDKVDLGGHDYEKAVIFYKKYDTSNIPEENILENDLNDILDYYSMYLNKENLLTDGVDFQNCVDGVEEGKRKLVKHYARERNSKIIKEAKKRELLKSGKLSCSVCGFDFGKIYGDRGNNYIEAHHIKPVSLMQENETTKVDDIVLLCSNCHKMIHVKSPWLSVDELIEIVK